MRERSNIRDVAVLQPDFLGFIFYPLSPRYAGEMLSADILDRLSPGIKKTGVFVNPPLQDVLQVSWRFSLDTIQLHGVESPSLCGDLRSKGLKVIKAFSFQKKEDIKKCRDYIHFADYFLFDSVTPGYGGSGRKFKWEILDEYDLEKPFFLSGGIGQEDLADIMGIRNPALYGIDLNSRFETEPGMKNVEMIREFIIQIRNNNLNHE